MRLSEMRASDRARVYQAMEQRKRRSGCAFFAFLVFYGLFMLGLGAFLVQTFGGAR